MSNTAWTDAHHFALLRYPVPGSFGLHSMRAACLIAENRPLHQDAAYIAFNERRTMLIILYVREGGRTDVTKCYVGGGAHRFAVDEHLGGTGSKPRLVLLSAAEAADLVENPCAPSAP